MERQATFWGTMYKDGQVLEPYADTDERPHAVGVDRLWQESVVILWHDENHDIGGYSDPAKTRVIVAEPQSSVESGPSK